MYPDEFYYEITTSVSGFQKEVSGKFDIQRLLQHRRDFWVAPTPKIKKIPKVIVFDLSLVKSISYKYRPNLIQLIGEMIDDGFQVYCNTMSPAFKFKKGVLENQINEFYILDNNVFYSENRHKINYKHIFHFDQIATCFKLFKNNLIPEYLNGRPFYLSDSSSYDYLVNDQLQLSKIDEQKLLDSRITKSEKCSNSNIADTNIHKVIHRIEFLHFKKTIPQAFYEADLSNLFKLKLENIRINRELAAFLKTLPIKYLELNSCIINTIRDVRLFARNKSCPCPMKW